MKSIVSSFWILIFSISWRGTNLTMTEAQLKITLRLVRNVCQPRTQATDADIQKIRSGNWNVDHAAMCYLYCVLSKNKLMTKENTFNLEVGIRFAKKRLPEARKDTSVEIMNKCKDAAKTLNDKCVAAFEVSKCFFEVDPKNNLLP